MKGQPKFSQLFILAAALGLGLAAAAAPGGAYESGLTRLRDGDLAAALDWFAAAKKEGNGGAATAQRLLLYAARELSFLALQKDCRDGQQLSLPSLEKKRENRPFEALCRKYQQRGQEAARGLLQECRDFAAQDKGQAMTLEAGLKNPDDSPSRWRDQLSKGEMPEEEDLSRLEKGLTVENYRNLLGEVLGQGASPAEVPLSGTAQRHRLYLVCGGRLAIISGSPAAAPQHQEYREAALAALNQAIALAPKGLDPGLLRAEEQKRALLEEQRQATLRQQTPPRLCPKCHQEMKGDWVFCPYDGTSLTAGKK